MTKFSYKAKNWDGNIIYGDMECETEECCRNKLREKGYFVISLTNEGGNEYGEGSKNYDKYLDNFEKYLNGDVAYGCGCFSFFCSLGVFFWLAGAEIGVYVFVVIGLMIIMSVLVFNRLKSKKARKNIWVYVWAPFSLCYVVYVLWCVVYWVFGEDKADYGFLVFKEIMVIILIAVVAFIIYSIDIKIKNNIQKRLDYELKDKNKQLDFEKAYPEVAKRYSSVIECIQKNGSSLDMYEKSVRDIYSKSMELYFKTKEIEDETKNYKTIVFELKKSISMSNDEEKNAVSINNLQRLEAKLEKYEQYIQEVNNTINGTAQDFLNIEIELMNNDFKKSDDFNEIESSLNSLEAKSKSLAYIQSHLPVFD